MSWLVGIHTRKHPVAKLNMAAAEIASRGVVVIIVRFFVGDSAPPFVLSLVTPRCLQSLEGNAYPKSYKGER